MTAVQKFKPNDAVEDKFRLSAEPAFDQTEQALDDFFENGGNSEPFLLMLYDIGRMPFSQRLKRDVFVQFIRQALINFPVTGTFEAYLFVLREVFGADSEIVFEVPDPGKLSIEVNASADQTFEFIGREFDSGTGQYSFFNMQTQDGYDLAFRGFSGIESEYELGLLFKEIMPAGIVPDITLQFFIKSVFVAEMDSVFYDVVDQDGNQIVFIETGG